MKATSEKIRALFVTEQNSDLTTGEHFRFWKANFPHLVRRIGRKDVIVASGAGAGRG